MNHHRLRVRWLAFMGFIIIVLTACTLEPGSRIPATITTPQGAATAPLPDLTHLVIKQGPTVVNISTTQKVSIADLLSQFPGLTPKNPLYKYFQRFLEPLRQSKESYTENLGSGLIVSSDGYILTNTHLMANAVDITVRLMDKREFPAKLIGSDSRSDIALIKIEASNLPTPPIGDPDKLKVGEWVLAIGTPFGFENSVTAGIVSGKGRALPEESYIPFIQTDVAVNPGNSGGPLFNLQGEVVGINSQIYSRSGGYMGISFAIPINLAIRIKDELRQHGKIRWGKLGIGIQQVTAALADSFGLDRPRGALINFIEPKGPAAQAGLQTGDIILRFNQADIEDYTDLPRQVSQIKPRARLPLEIWRNARIKALSIEVAELIPSEMATSSVPLDNPNHRDGLGIRELSPKERQKLHTKGQLIIEAVEGEALRAGLQEGDVILAVNSMPVQNYQHFQQLMKSAAKRVALLIQRGTGMRYFSLRAWDTY